MASCRAGDEVMHNEDWGSTFAERCYFYPGRDCPGWDAGGVCGRIGERIPGPGPVPPEPDADHDRRIGAVEAHLADLEDRLNARGIFSGEVSGHAGNADR